MNIRSSSLNILSIYLFLLVIVCGCTTASSILKLPVELQSKLGGYLNLNETLKVRLLHPKFRDFANHNYISFRFALAAIGNDLDYMKALLNQGGRNKVDIKFQNYSALRIALAMGHREIIKFMVERTGVDGVLNAINEASEGVQLDDISFILSLVPEIPEMYGKFYPTSKVLDPHVERAVRTESFSFIKSIEKYRIGREAIEACYRTRAMANDVDSLKAMEGIYTSPDNHMSALTYSFRRGALDSLRYLLSLDSINPNAWYELNLSNIYGPHELNVASAMAQLYLSNPRTSLDFDGFLFLKKAEAYHDEATVSILKERLGLST